jgi:hypothetical protein
MRQPEWPSATDWAAVVKERDDRTLSGTEG